MGNMFNWLLYLDLADDLATNGTESSCRSAVSRAYYGVFGKIRDTLEKDGKLFSPGNIHMEIISWLNNHDDAKIRIIGREMNRLRRERNNADYEAGIVFDESRTLESLDRSHSIIMMTKAVKLIS